MTLPKETLEAIRKEAKDYALNLAFPITWSSERVEGARDDAATDYEKAATEWAGKAQGLAETLKWIQMHCPIEPIVDDAISAALAKYKEVENEKK